MELYKNLLFILDNKPKATFNIYLQILFIMQSIKNRIIWI